MSILRTYNVQNPDSATTNIQLSANGGIAVAGITTVAAGSTSAPSITPTGNSNTGIFFPSADTIAFAEGGVEAARFDSSGKLGIGTVNPSEGLHVVRASNGGQFAVDNTGQQYTSVNFKNSGTRKGVLEWNNTAEELGLAVDSSGSPTGSLSFSTGNTKRAVIDSSGRLLIGGGSSRQIDTVWGYYDSQFQSEGVASGAPSGISVIHNSSGGYPAYLALGASKATSLGGNTIVTNGMALGRISFQGSDGSKLVEAASIDCGCDGTPGTNDMPGNLTFSTTPDSQSSPTERMKIDSAGRVTTPYQPSFFAYLTTTVSAFAPGYSGKVLFSTERFDVGSCYDAPNSQCVAPVAGKYFFKVELYLGFEGTGVRVGHAGWYVNGSINHGANIIGGVTNGGGTQYHPTAISSTILNLSANDSVDFRWTGIGGNFTGGYMYAGEQTNFQGFLIG